jgi:hypothetical protein
MTLLTTIATVGVLASAPYLVVKYFIEKIAAAESRIGYGSLSQKVSSKKSALDPTNIELTSMNSLFDNVYPHHAPDDD